MSDKPIRRTEMVESVPLLPCPFCNGEAEIRGEILLFVRCAKCGTRLGEGYYATKAEAIAAWNTRAERTCKREKHGAKMDGSPKLRCSLCGYGIGDKRWSYCPNCGCKVVGE